MGEWSKDEILAGEITWQAQRISEAKQRELNKQRMMQRSAGRVLGGKSDVAKRAEAAAALNAQREEARLQAAQHSLKLLREKQAREAEELSKRREAITKQQKATIRSRNKFLRQLQKGKYAELFKDYKIWEIPHDRTLINRAAKAESQLAGFVAPEKEFEQRYKDKFGKTVSITEHAKLLGDAWDIVHNRFENYYNLMPEKFVEALETKSITKLRRFVDSNGTSAANYLSGAGEEKLLKFTLNRAEQVMDKRAVEFSIGERDVRQRLAAARKAEIDDMMARYEARHADD